MIIAKKLAKVYTYEVVSINHPSIFFDKKLDRYRKREVIIF